MELPNAGTDVRSGVDAAGVWAVIGVASLFLVAVVRLGARGLITMRAGLEPTEWVALIALTAAFVYGEGIRALQRRYVPHVFRRVARLRSERRWYRLLAPLYAMSLVGPPWRTLIGAWAGVAAIVVAVKVIARLPEPWRGIIDFAVAAALAWAATVLVLRAFRVLRGQGASNGI